MIWFSNYRMKLNPDKFYLLLKDTLVQKPQNQLNIIQEFVKIEYWVLLIDSVVSKRTHCKKNEGKKKNEVTRNRRLAFLQQIF